MSFSGRFLFSLLVIFVAPVQAQQAVLELGPDEIGVNQSFTITITVKEDKISSYDGFPDIQGLTKMGTSSSSRTEMINGQFSSSHSITMNYRPDQQGEIIIPAFRMTVNGEILNSEGITVKIGPPVQRRRSRFPNIFEDDPMEDFFGRREEPEYVDVKEDAFLALTPSKTNVFVGEGVTVDLSFYVADNNRAIMNFYDLGQQLSDILKDLRPDNCWEENFNIENVNGEHVMINGKGYTQWKLYEATFFPFNTDSIEFPSVELEMIKYKIAKNPTFFGTNRKEDFKSFKSKPKAVLVKPLPPHPMKDMVAVGDYKLNETLSSDILETGQSFKYDFTIYGEGNISALEKPVIPKDKNFDFYEPNISQKINRRNRRITGNKVFSYYGIPNEPGLYKMRDYFNFVFFNPKTEEYDTLQSKYHVSVKGESRKNESIMASDLGSFYDRISFEDNKLSSGSLDWLKIFANIFILGAILISAILVFKK